MEYETAPSSQCSTQGIRDTQEICSQQLEQSVMEENVWGRLFSLSHNSKVYNLTEPFYSFGRGDVTHRFTEQMFDKTFLSTLSKTHFLLYREESASKDAVVVLEDKSQNGTYVNKVFIGRGKKKVLCNNDEISLALSKKRVFVFYDCLKNDSEDYPTCLTEKYTVTKKIGDGSYGEVRLAYSQGSLNKVAVKIVKKKFVSAKGTTVHFFIDQINNEIKLLRSVSHPCIVQLLDIFEGPEKIYIVMELAEGGELFDRIASQGRLEEDTAKLYFYQLSHAVLYLHSKNITHRDIKPENVLLATEDQHTRIKLTDFGLSKLTVNASAMTSLCGTPAYIAPELLIPDEGRSYTSKVDMWSLGVVLFVCLAGYPPFQGRNDRETQINIRKAHYRIRTDIWDAISITALDLVKRLLVLDPEERLSAKQVLQHPWLDDSEMTKMAQTLMYPPSQKNQSPLKRSLSNASDEELVDSKTPKLMGGVEFSLNC